MRIRDSFSGGLFFSLPNQNFTLLRGPGLGQIAVKIKLFLFDRGVANRNFEFAGTLNVILFLGGADVTARDFQQFAPLNIVAFLFRGGLGDCGVELGLTGREFVLCVAELSDQLVLGVRRGGRVLGLGAELACIADVDRVER